jgi:hypothetical protein
VQCTAWDASGNTNQSSFTVTVVDTQPPQIACPGNVTVVKTRPEGAQLFYQLQAADTCDTNLMVEYSMPPGATFAPGTTTVTCAVTDASGNRNTCSFQVTVVEAQPGSITGLNVAAHAVSLSIPTQAGVQYAVEYKNSLDDSIWQPLVTVSGDRTVMTITDPNPPETMRFYRVRAP